MKASYSVRVVAEATGSLGLGGAYILPRISAESVSGILHSISQSSHRSQILEQVDFKASFADALSLGIGHLLDVPVPAPTLVQETPLRVTGDEHGVVDDCNLLCHGGQLARCRRLGGIDRRDEEMRMRRLLSMTVMRLRDFWCGGPPPLYIPAGVCVRHQSPSLKSSRLTRPRPTNRIAPPVLGADQGLLRRG
jgi:hypothetical protein